MKVIFYVLRVFVVNCWFFLASTLVLPILALRPKHPYNTVIYTRVVMRVCVWLLGIKLEVRGLEKMKAAHPSVIVGNHQSVIDLFLHGTFIPAATVTVGKKSIIWIPIFGWIYALVGSVFIDRKNRASAMSSMSSALDLIQKKKWSVWIFAEGTRSQGRGLLPFKKGAFHLAIEAQCPVVPLATSQYHKGLDLKKLRSGRVIVEVQEPIPTSGLTPLDVDALLQRARESIRIAIERLDAEIQGG